MFHKQAGNNGESGDFTITPPAAAKNVIAVGSSLNSLQAWTSTFCSESSLRDTNLCESVKTWGDDVHEELV